MRSSATACLAAVLALAAAPALAATSPVAIPYEGKSYHLYVPNRHAPPPASTMLYYGGPVIAQVNVIAVFWGSGVAKTTTSQIGPFLAAMANSTYVDQLAQYSTVGITGVNGMPGTNQTIVRGSLRGKFKITPVNTSLNLTDADVQTEIEGQIASGNLPRKNLNNLYMIYFPANITISLGNAKSCQAFGAYHEAVLGKPRPNNLFYGVMPDCGGGFTEQTVVSSHEFAEAISDAIPTPGSHPAFPQAWNDANGNEIGDLCEGRNTTLTAAGQTYTVQEVFDNSHNACATGKFTSP